MTTGKPSLRRLPYLRKADGTLVPMTRRRKMLDGEAEQVAGKTRSVGDYWVSRRDFFILKG